MRAVKKLNNNTVICVDGKGNELIAMGKGIGFKTVPREVDIEEVERTFYNLKESEQNILKDLSPEIVTFTAGLMDIIKSELPYELNSNAVLVMADHIAFAIDRKRQNISVKMPLLYDVQQMYPLEFKIGKYILQKIEKKFQINLPQDEIAGIALNLINSRMNSKKAIDQNEIQEYEKMLDEITEIVESTQRIIIDKDSFDYSRYATHLYYLFQRVQTQKNINSVNYELYQDVLERFPDIEPCVSKICKHIYSKWNVELSKDEKLYLMLHINRICTKKGL